MTTVEFADLAAAAFAELLALQFQLDTFVRHGSWHAMQRRVVAQVLLHRKVQVQRALLEHHAKTRKGLARRFTQIEAGDTDLPLL